MKSGVLSKAMLLAGLFTGGIPVTQIRAQSAAPASKPPVAAARARYQGDHFAGRAGMYYRLVWGIESLSVKWAESGEMIRFSYHVLDADKAKALNGHSTIRRTSLP